MFWCHAMCFDKTTTKNNIWRESNIHGNFKGRLISATRLIFGENPVLIARFGKMKFPFEAKLLFERLLKLASLGLPNLKRSVEITGENRRFDWVCVLEEIMSFPGALKAHMSSFFKASRILKSHHKANSPHQIAYHNVAWRNLNCAFKNN